MAYYLIDYENTHSLNGIDALSERDSVIVFYSKNSNSMTFDAHFALQNCKAKFEYKWVEVGGKNALDFQLSSYLGYLIAKTPNAHFYIISKDKGYSPLDKFWKNARISLCVDIAGTTQEKVVAEKNNSIETALKNAKMPLSNEDIRKVCGIVEQYKTKSSINNNLQKLIKDNDKVKNILTILKPYIKDKK